VAMYKYFAAYGAAALIMVALDALWLGVIAKTYYQQGMGHLMAENPRLLVAALFYALFVVGLLIFVVAPGGQTGTWQGTLLRGALFGFFTYATYDLTNLATLKDWPVGMSVADMAWGATVSAAAGAAGKFGFDYFA
jgi:uncharacterized membrane protein